VVGAGLRVAVPADDAGADQALAAPQVFAAADADQIGFFQVFERRARHRREQRRGRVRVARRDQDEARPDHGAGIDATDERHPKPSSLPCAGRAAEAADLQIAIAVAPRGAVLAAIEHVTDGREQLGARGGGRGAHDPGAAALELDEIGLVERRCLAHPSAPERRLCQARLGARAAG
jgi:hypothetical protein